MARGTPERHCRVSLHFSTGEGIKKIGELYEVMSIKNPNLDTWYLAVPFDGSLSINV